MPGLFKCLGNDKRDGLSEIGNVAWPLHRSFVCGALRGVAQQPLVGDDRKHTRHRAQRLFVDLCHLPLYDSGTDQHSDSFGSVPEFRRILRLPADFQWTVPARCRSAHDALHHVGKDIRLLCVHLVMCAHWFVSVAVRSTALSVRRASGILKSFAP